MRVILNNLSFAATTVLACLGALEAISSAAAQSVVRDAGQLTDTSRLPQTQAIPPTTAEQSILVRGVQRGVVAKYSAAGTKTDTPILETPQSITVITQSTLHLQDAQNLNQALRYVAGVTPETRGGDGTRYDEFVMRGFAADVYYNGLKLLKGTGYASPQVDVQLLQRVDILKGPGSVLYGQSVAGGLVDETGTMPEPGPLHGRVAVEGGNFRHAQAVGDVTGSVDAAGKWNFRLSGLARSEDAQTRHTRNERLTIEPSLSWRPDDRTMVSLLGLYDWSPKNGGYAGSLRGIDVPMGFFAGDTDYQRFDRKQASAGLQASRQINDWLRVRSNTRWYRVGVDYRTVYASYLDPVDPYIIHRGSGGSIASSDQYSSDNNVEARFKTGPVSHTLLAGIDYQHIAGAQDTGFGYEGHFEPPPLDLRHIDYTLPIVPPPRSSTNSTLTQIGVYIQDQLHWRGFVLTMSGRHDWARTTNRPAGGVLDAQRDSVNTGRVGLNYVFASGLAPYVSYAQSFQPTAGVDYRGRSLKPERGKQYEVGVKYAPPGKNILLTVDGFDLTRSNLTTSQPPTYQLVQTGEARSLGIEAEARATFGGLQLIANYAYVNAYYTHDLSGLQGKRIQAVPLNSASVWGIYTIGHTGLSLGGGVRYNSSKPNTENQYSVGNVTLVDLVMRYDLGVLQPRLKGMTLTSNVNNLLDRGYIASCYYDEWCAQGFRRTVTAGLAYAF